MSATSMLDILTVLDTHQPLSLGQVKMNPDGVLELKNAPSMPQHAQLSWYGVPVQISLHDAHDHVICDIVADLGQLPFSAQNPGQRGALVAVIRGFVPPADCRLMLGPRQAIWACQQTKLPLPLTPAGILSEIVVFLHGMSPIMALLSDIQHAYDGGQLGGKSLKESL